MLSVFEYTAPSGIHLLPSSSLNMLEVNQSKVPKISSARQLNPAKSYFDTPSSRPALSYKFSYGNSSAPPPS